LDRRVDADAIEQCRHRRQQAVGVTEILPPLAIRHVVEIAESSEHRPTNLIQVVADREVIEAVLVDDAVGIEPADLHPALEELKDVLRCRSEVGTEVSDRFAIECRPQIRPVDKVAAIRPSVAAAPPHCVTACRESSISDTCVTRPSSNGRTGASVRVIPSPAKPPYSACGGHTHPHCWPGRPSSGRTRRRRPRHRLRPAILRGVRRGCLGFGAVRHTVLL